MFGHVDRFLCQFQDEKTEVMTLVGFVTLVSNSSQQRCVDCVYVHVDLENNFVFTRVTVYESARV